MSVILSCIKGAMCCGNGMLSNSGCLHLFAHRIYTLLTVKLTALRGKKKIFKGILYSLYGQTKNSCLCWKINFEGGSSDHGATQADVFSDLGNPLVLKGNMLYYGGR